MPENADQNIIIWQYALNASWVLLPLVPSVLIYLIFPKTQTGLSGPFAGLTIRASGAFAAYFLVLLATFPLLNRQNNNLETLLRPSWEITGHVQLEDENGAQIPFNNRGNSPFRIELDPKLVEPLGRRGFKAIVPEVSHKVPTLLITYPGFAEFILDPMSPDGGDNVIVDPRTKKIEITSPIIMRRQPCVGPACGQQP